MFTTIVTKVLIFEGNKKSKYVELIPILLWDDQVFRPPLQWRHNERDGVSITNLIIFY